MAEHAEHHGDGPVHDAHHAAAKAHGHLTKKIGPLPMWAWIALGTGGALVLVLVIRSNSGTSASASTPSTGVVGDAQTGIDSGAYTDPNGGVGDGAAGSVGDATYQDQPATDSTYADDGTGLTITLTGGGVADPGTPTTNDAAKTTAAKKVATHTAAKRKTSKALASTAQANGAKTTHSLGTAVKKPTHTAAVHATAHNIIAAPAFRASSPGTANAPAPRQITAGETPEHFAAETARMKAQTAREAAAVKKRNAENAAAAAAAARKKKKH